MMQFEQWPLDKLTAYAGNPRKNDHAVEAVSKAIREYGFRVPILAKSTGEIIDGHLRYKAAVHAGLVDVPVLIADDMSDAQVRAFRLSVNKVAELAKWDNSLLEQELKALQLDDIDISIIGFSEVELEAFVGPESAGSGNKDEIPTVKTNVAKVGDLWLLGDHRLYVGDLWLLGDHRLYVGDSTTTESYATLLGDELVDLVWSDPPYNVDYSGKAGKIKNDAMSPGQFEDFLSAFFTAVCSAMRAGAPIYIAHADGLPGLAFRKSFLGAGFHLSACLIWRKNAAVMGRADYQFQHEPILYGWKEGKAHSWYGGRKRRTIIDFSDGAEFTEVSPGVFHVSVGPNTIQVTGIDVQVQSLQPSVISIDKPHHSDLHPTMKPVALVEHCMVNSSQRGDLVLDGFGGSGTTLIACEILNRRARLIELDEKFADVIICRWQEFTGREATLEGGSTYSNEKENRVKRAN